MAMRELSLRVLLAEDGPRRQEGKTTTKKDSVGERDAETAYVSLVDLRDDSTAARLLLASSSESDLALLVDPDAQRMQRVQDILLMHIVGISVALAVWACDQLYSGRVCALLGADHARKCDELVTTDGTRGAPDGLLYRPLGEDLDSHSQIGSVVVSFRGKFAVVFLHPSTVLFSLLLLLLLLLAAEPCGDLQR
ncbi:hypothetical protein ATCC90586_007955 [Pythium insidiosum]|nr:hypothetical protein ATCC90586_007955 [Pythium insidiosum]